MTYRYVIGQFPDVIFGTGHGTPQKFTRAPIVNLRIPLAVVMRPKLVESIVIFTAVGGSKIGWFNTLTASTRNSNSFVSVIFTRLMRLASKLKRAGPSIHFRPRLPFCPGAGFTRRTLPCASVIALLVKLPLSPLADVTPATAGSVIC